MVKIKNFKHIYVQKISKLYNSLKTSIVKKLLGLEGLRWTMNSNCKISKSLSQLTRKYFSLNFFGIYYYNKWMWTSFLKFAKICLYVARIADLELDNWVIPMWSIDQYHFHQFFTNFILPLSYNTSLFFSLDLAYYNQMILK